MTRRKKKVEPRIRFNWGYWDGHAYRANGTLPLWAKQAHDKHPFDPAYGAGVWAGYEDEANQPSHSDVAWTCYMRGVRADAAAARRARNA